MHHDATDFNYTWSAALAHLRKTTYNFSGTYKLFIYGSKVFKTYPYKYTAKSMRFSIIYPDMR